MSEACTKCGQEHGRTPCPKFPPGFGDCTALQAKLTEAKNLLWDGQISLDPEHKTKWSEVVDKFLGDFKKTS